jgi:hypothetical protein
VKIGRASLYRMLGSSKADAIPGGSSGGQGATNGDLADDRGS